MNDDTQLLVERLRRWLSSLGDASVAVSGGVDSTTLAIFAGRALGDRLQVFHACSPAVPPDATARVKETARREDWQLHLLDAGEFEDETYLRNPYRRCFYCKDHLYDTIAAFGASNLLSGTNCDDIKDFRPGLDAARRYGVRHPFVECEVNKNGVRRICRNLGYANLSELPASPCLSSRIETGIRIDPAVLGFVDRVEAELRERLSASVVRCRIRAREIAVQLDPDALSRLSSGISAEWSHRIRDLALPLGLPAAVRFENYRMGSAFVPDH